MNRTAKATAAPFAALTCALALQTATPAQASMSTWQENSATPAVQIDVGSDMTLSAALTANGVSLAGAASLVKTGSGTVTVDDASGIGSFAGDIHVFQGGWQVGTSAGFGTSAGATWVYPNGCVLITDVTISHSGETFRLAGTGKSDWYGWGAIRFPTDTQQNNAMAAGAYGSRWILEDDATVMVSGNGNGATFLPSIDLELNGHELTLWRGRYGAISTYSSSTAKYGMFNSVTGTGGIVMENGVTFGKDRYGFKPSSYTAGNYLALQNAYLGIWETQNLHADWGLVTKSLPAANWDGSGTAASHKPMILLLSWKGSDWQVHDFNMWQGPVTLQEDLQIIQENQNHIHPMTFTGKITGDGGLDVTSGKIWLYLDNPENDFKGGVRLAGPNDGLVLANNGALPANGGDLVATDSTITLAPSSAGTWTLPGLQFHGAGRVANASASISPGGAWSRVTKTGDGELKWDTTVGADTLDVREGTVTLSSTYSQSDYYGYRMWASTDMGGVWTFEQLRATGVKMDHASEKNGIYVYNWFNNALSSNTQYSPIGSNSNGAIGYEGWVWCDGPDGTEWTFALSYGTGDTFYLKINDIVLWNFKHRGYVTAENTPRYNVAMKHGWNRFLGMTKYGWTAANSSDDLWTLKGLCVDKQGRGTSNSSDYSYLSDPGDGSSVVYMCGDNEADGRAWHGTFGTLAMRGGLLDLGGRDYTFAGFENAGTVVSNGNATVTTTWTIDCSKVAFDDWAPSAFTGTLTIGDNAEIVLENALSWPREFDIELATAGVAISRAPSVRVVGGYPGNNVKAELTGAGNTTLKLSSARPVLTLSFR